jgi:tetratricopeptide (TPR) repeat protein
MFRKATLALAALLASGGLQANASVTVIGGGMAEACWRAVKAGEADQAVLETCTYAIEQESLRRRDRAGTLVNRGIVQLRMRSLKNALADFNKAQDINPAIGETYVNRGAVLIMMDRYPEALEDIERGMTIGVEEPQKAYYNRAIAKEGVEDMRGAYFDYLKAAELDPAWTLPQTQLARFTVTRR